ncbi:hypothetical protein B0H13DRAFT_1886541 [Mycena leptocephala]|nr:hypothetical protein B0H13DRAFT_1886541 [Mycena leptocephala]
MSGMQHGRECHTRTTAMKAVLDVGARCRDPADSLRRRDGRGQVVLVVEGKGRTELVNDVLLFRCFGRDIVDAPTISAFDRNIDNVLRTATVLLLMTDMVRGWSMVYHRLPKTNERTYAAALEGAGGYEKRANTPTKVGSQQEGVSMGNMPGTDMRIQI